MFRKILFWCHLLTGLAGGLVILLMSVTGVLLTYEKQIIAYADRQELASASNGRDAAVTTSGSDRPDMEQLLTAATLSGPMSGRAPSSVTLRSGASEPVALSFPGAVMLTDPATGRMVPQNTSVRAFFRSMTDWHRWLGVAAGGGGNGSPEARARARAITGASNLGFLFLVVSGLYLWFPRKWRWQNLRAVLWFRGGLAPKARDFNWHNVAGFWTCVPLFVIVLSGVVMSYPWANNLVYTLNGVEAPPPRGAAKGKAGPGEAKGKGGEFAKAGEARGKGGNGKAGDARGKDDRRQGAAAESLEVASVSTAGLNALVAQAQSLYPEWRTMSITLPKTDADPVSFNIDEGNGGQPQLRTTLVLARSGDVVRRDVFGDQDAGRRARSWMRFAHTGEYYGFLGQTIAGIASVAGVLLVWTGFALAWRRFRAWMARDRSRAVEGARQAAA